jgi:hypothetical protein
MPLFGKHSHDVTERMKRVGFGLSIAKAIDLTLILVFAVNADYITLEAEQYSDHESRLLSVGMNI